MSLNTSSESDGRIHRARKPMRKIIALGLSKDELLDLYGSARERRSQRRVAQDELGEAVAPDARLEQARKLIRRLIALGFAEVDIAHLCDLSPSTITRVLDPHEARILSAEKTQELRDVVKHAGRQRLAAVLPCVRVQVLETCCDKGVAIDPVANAQLEAGSRGALINALLGLGAADVIAPGVAAVLFELGEPEEGITVIVAPRRGAAGDAARLVQLRALEHEVGHLQRAYQVERERIEQDLLVVSKHSTPKAHA